MQERQTISTDLEFIRFLKATGSETMKKCFQCATCTVACALSPKEYSFPRKEMINAGWGLKDKLVTDADIWLCHGCMDCSTQCPRGARPADLLGSVRAWVYQHYGYPAFMGKALASPKYLPVLFIIPVILISILIMVTQQWDLSNLFPIENGAFRYKDFIAHGPIEMLFIAGNVLIFAFAYIGFRKYFNDMTIPGAGRKKMNFIPAAIKVAEDLIVHKKFESCKENSTRFYGHLFLFYGFMGALIATAVVVVDVMGVFGKFLPHDMNLPFYIVPVFDINNPEHISEMIGLITKLVGMTGGMMMIIGGLLFIVRRYSMAKREGRSSYYDLLFLWVIWGVAFTGMLLVVFRLTGLATAGYPTYFIHLILVYFLLWYMPFSKFAHMIYRFLGLIKLKMYGRDNKPLVFSNN